MDSQSSIENSKSKGVPRQNALASFFEAAEFERVAVKMTFELLLLPAVRKYSISSGAYRTCGILYDANRGLRQQHQIIVWSI